METDLSLSDIAAECGFCNPNYFGDIFKLVNGISPSEFSKNNKPNTKQKKGFHIRQTRYESPQKPLLTGFVFIY
ncbi:helix-turn-helix domain-containing protein [Lachnospira eligens]|uniref:helix-turn-helix domain-containing protein n=1 Tax=Lachnospira eligens TaxID=39485 RepID=UPI001899A17C